MKRYSKDDRQRILDKHLAEHGRYDAAEFVEIVHAKGPEHEAYDWFEWNNAEAAAKWRVDQAREFVHGLRIEYEIKTIDFGRIKVLGREFGPAVISPVENRQRGGGYVALDPDDSGVMNSFAEEGAQALERWLERYAVALLSRQIDKGPIEDIIEALRRKDSKAA